MFVVYIPIFINIYFKNAAFIEGTLKFYRSKLIHVFFGQKYKFDVCWLNTDFYFGISRHLYIQNDYKKK